MDDIDREADDFFKAILAVQDDPEYENEWVPAYHFEENASRDLGLQVTDREKNDDDPPDYFYRVDGSRIGMEITSLLGGKVMQQNALYKRIETAMENRIEGIKRELPLGKYELNFFPGEMKEVAPGVKMDVHILGNRIAHNDIGPRVAVCLDELAASYDRKYVTAKLTNPNGELIGTVRLIPLGEADQVDIFIHPQGAYIMEDWTPEKLQMRLQKCVDDKEAQYGGGNLTDIIGMPIWLLISDTRDIMSTSGIEFDLGSIALNSRSFQRIFFIRGLASDYRISEVKCDTQ